MPDRDAAGGGSDAAGDPALRADDPAVPGYRPGGGFAVRPVLGVPELRPGDDLAGLLAAAAPWLRDGDVVVVTSKAVSKVEGRLLRVPTDPAGREDARQAAVAAETVRVVARRGRTTIAQTRHGLVLASAGVDASNVRPDEIALLPVDPDASAAGLRAGLHAALGVTVGVVVSDTLGRPWRRGLTDAAIGLAGIPAVVDLRGAADSYGNVLELTEVAVADEIAAAADLAKGKLGGVAAAVVRGLSLADDGSGARSLVRPAEEDMFRLGTAEAAAAGRAEVVAALAAPVAAFRPDPVPDGALARAAAAGEPCAYTAAGPEPVAGLPPAPAYVLASRPADLDAFAAGAAVERFRAALAAEHLASVVAAPPPATLAAPAPGTVPVAVLAVGRPGPR